MLFRRRQTERVAGPSGPVQHGLEAVLQTERAIGSITALMESVYGSERRADDGHAFSRGSDALSYAFGRVAAGQRAAAVVTLEGCAEALPVIEQAVSARLPLVVFVLADGPWDAVFRAGAAGAVVLAATCARDAAALAAASHRAAEDVLVPVVCVLDASRVAHAAADIPTGRAVDLQTLFSGPHVSRDPAQRLLFGAERESIPTRIDPDRPAGVGAALAGMDRTAAIAARRLLLNDEIGDSIDRALTTASDVVGRHLDPVQVSGGDRAPVSFVTAGPVLPDHAGAYRTVSCVRLFPFPLEAVLTRIGRGRTSLLLPVTPGTDTMRLAAGIASVAGHPMPVGYLPASFEPDLGDDLAEAARRLADGALADPYFPSAWRGMDRPGLPEAERLEQRLRAAHPGLDRALVSGRPDGRAGLAVVFAGPSLGPLVEAELAAALTEVTGLAAQSFSLRSDAVAVTIGGASTAPPAGRAHAVVVERSADLDRNALFDLLGRDTQVVVGDGGSLSAEATIRIRSAGARLIHLKPAQDGLPHPWKSSIALLATTPLPATPGPSGPIPDDAARQTARAVVARLAAAGLLPDAHTEALLARADTASTAALDVPAGPRDEPDRPSVVVRGAPESDRPADPLRFWRTVGFAHAAGRSAELVPDPYRAMGVLPARAGWAPTGSGVPASMPAVVAERCTGCGDCWSLCPTDALVPAAPSFAQALDAAFAGLEAAGGSAFQLGRLRKAVAQEAHRVFGADAIHQFRTLDVLLAEAVERVLIKGKVEGGKRDELVAEWTELSKHVPSVATARTDAWFGSAEDRAKGSGRALTLAVDPDRCTACGLCIAACPEGALEPSEPTPADIGLAGAASRFVRTLAAPSPEESTATGLPAVAAHALSHPDEVSAADDAVAATLHVTALAAGAAADQARAALLTRAASLRAGLEDEARKVMSGMVAINDFEAFGRQLAALGEDVTPDRLVTSVSTGAELDTHRLKRLAHMQTSLQQLEQAWKGGDTGRGRATIVAVFDGSPTVRWPVNPFGFPWLRVAAGSGPAALSALTDSLEHRHAGDCDVLRTAERVARQTSSGDESPAGFARLAAEERAAAPAPLLVTDRLGDGVLRLLDEGRRVRVLLLDRDPMSAGDPAIAASAMGSAFVAQVTLGRPREMVQALHAAFAHDGPALVHALVPDGPVTDAFVRASEAVLSRVFPVFSYAPPSRERPAGRFDLSGNASPAEDWTDERHDPIDWVARDARIARSWHVTARGEEPAGLLTARDALAGQDDAVVGLPRSGGRTALLPDAVLAAARRRLAAWRRLRAMAMACDRTDGVAPPPVVAESEPVPSLPAQVLLPPEMHDRLTQRLLALSGFAPGDPRAAESLRTLTAIESVEDAT